LFGLGIDGERERRRQRRGALRDLVIHILAAERLRAGQGSARKEIGFFDVGSG
jgi:hypothetical protein